MRRRLAKLAQVSSKLRAGIQKEAFVGAAVKGAVSFAKKNPVKTFGGALAGVGAVGSYRQTKAGFDPAVQKAMLGTPPTPPGAER